MEDKIIKNGKPVYKKVERPKELNFESEKAKWWNENQPAVENFSNTAFTTNIGKIQL